MGTEQEKPKWKPGPEAILKRARLAKSYAHWKGYNTIAEDFSQWVALRLSEGLGVKQEPHQALVDYLRATASNPQSMDLMRRCVRVGNVGGDSGQPATELPPEAEKRRRHGPELIKSLELKATLNSQELRRRKVQRAMFILSSEWGFTAEELAYIFQTTRQAVWASVAEARAIIKQESIDEGNKCQTR